MFVDISLLDYTMRGATKIVIFLKVLMKAPVQKKGIQVTTFLTKTVWHGLKIQGQKTVKQTYMDERSQGLPTGIHFFSKKILKTKSLENHTPVTSGQGLLCRWEKSQRPYQQLDEERGKGIPRHNSGTFVLESVSSSAGIVFSSSTFWNPTPTSA